MNRKPKGKLFSFLFPAFLFITIWNVVALSWTSVSNLNEFNQSQAKQSLLNQAKLFSKAIENITDEETLLRLCQEVSEGSDISFSVITPQGKILASNQKNLLGQDRSQSLEIKEVLKKGTFFNQRTSLQSPGQSFYYVSYYNPQQLFITRTQLPIKSLRDNSIDFLYKTFFTAFISLIISLLLAYFASKRISNPIRKLQLVAKRYAKRELHAFREDQPWEEFESLSESLSKMAREIDQQISKLTLQKKETEAVLASMKESVIALSPENKLLSANESAEKLLRFRASPLINEPFFEVVLCSPLQNLIKETNETKKEIREDFVLSIGNLEKVIEFRGNQLISDKGKILGTLVVLDNVTEKRQFDQIRRDFVGNVSHELRTPITSIQGFVEIIQDDDELELKDRKHFMKIIDRQTKRLGAIIEDLLSLSRLDQIQDPQSLAKNWHRLNGLFNSARDLCSQLASSKKITLDFHREDHLEIKMNQGLMEQALVNLVNNAIKYSPENTRVQIEIQEEENFLLLKVTDQGPGIPEEHQSRLFERFFRVDKARSRAAGGTGLGLSITKHIARLHNSQIGLKSVVGKGSTFYLEIPISMVRNLTQ